MGTIRKLLFSLAIKIMIFVNTWSCDERVPAGADWDNLAHRETAERTAPSKMSFLPPPPGFNLFLHYIFPNAGKRDVLPSRFDVLGGKNGNGIGIGRNVLVIGKDRYIR